MRCSMLFSDIKGIKGIKGIGRRDVHPPASAPESSPAVHTRVCRALGTRCCRVVGCGSTWFTHVALCGLGSCLSYVCDLCLTVQDCVDTSACCYHKGMFDRPTTDWPSTPLAPPCRSGLRVVGATLPGPALPALPCLGHLVLVSVSIALVVG